MFGLLGPNGAGKSTLIRMLTTLVPPTSGTARVNGFDVVRAANDVRQSIGVIPQAMTSDLDLSAVENMSIFAKLYGIPREKRVRTIKALLKEVDLEQWADKPVKMFSGGMRRRLEIARGLVHEPKIFFLDEPTTGLDPVSRVAVWEMLVRLKTRTGPDDSRDDALHGRGGQAVRPDRDCGSWEAGGAGFAAEIEGFHSGEEYSGGQFSGVPGDWMETLNALPDVAEVKAEENVFRISSHNGPRTTVALMEAARRADATVASLSVQSTTLDDVFVHYTGHQLRDALQAPSATDSPFIMQRTWRADSYAPSLGHY